MVGVDEAEAAQALAQASSSLCLCFHLFTIVFEVLNFLKILK